MVYRPTRTGLPIGGYDRRPICVQGASTCYTSANHWTCSATGLRRAAQT